MTKSAILFILSFAIIGCNSQKTPPAPTSASPAAAATPVSGPFSDQELKKFNALDPIDTHVHAYQNAPAFFAMLQRLNIHVLDILVAREPDQKSLNKERQEAWDFVSASNGHASLCTTFDPFLYKQRDFAKMAIAEVNRDFARGAVAVKIWKNIGEQIKDEKGNYLMADNPVFEPIYKDIAAHDKTLIAHLADPNTMWEPPNPAVPDYSYYMQHPEWYMYNKPNAPSKEAILRARDHLVEENPNLRVVGAHVGSMEADFKQLGDRLDSYPNFAVDMAARMPYFVMKPRADMIAFIEKYQDRLIYGTDNEFRPDEQAQYAIKRWEGTYAFNWRYLATNDTVQYHDHKVQGLALPPEVLHKIYHDNAVKWFPGILRNSH
jgi:predicted TIM-barrel fold metal-dependent hydrolase